MIPEPLFPDLLFERGWVALRLCPFRQIGRGVEDEFLDSLAFEILAQGLDVPDPELVTGLIRYQGGVRLE
jgi:hypothetical protein